jgi:hypothetical protein
MLEGKIERDYFLTFNLVTEQCAFLYKKKCRHHLWTAPYEKSWQPQRILGDEKGQLHEFILTGWCQVASCHLQEVQFCEAKERDAEELLYNSGFRVSYELA